VIIPFGLIIEFRFVSMIWWFPDPVSTALDWSRLVAGLTLWNILPSILWIPSPKETNSALIWWPDVRCESPIIYIFLNPIVVLTIRLESKRIVPVWEIKVNSVCIIISSPII